LYKNCCDCNVTTTIVAGIFSITHSDLIIFKVHPFS
jgi:hypothetical protein